METISTIDISCKCFKMFKKLSLRIFLSGCFCIFSVPWNLISKFLVRTFYIYIPFYIYGIFLVFRMVSSHFMWKSFLPTFFLQCSLPRFFWQFCWHVFLKRFPSSFLQNFFPFFPEFLLMTGNFTSNYIEWTEQIKYLTELMYLKASITRSKLVILP